MSAEVRKYKITWVIGGIEVSTDWLEFLPNEAMDIMGDITHGKTVNVEWFTE